MREDLADRPRLGDERNQPDGTTARRGTVLAELTIAPDCWWGVG